MSLLRYAQAQNERETHKESLAAKFEVTGHPKLDLCYDLAWEHGHSSGFSEVEYYFSDLVQLIK